MEERKIVESNNSYQKKIKKTLLVFIIIVITAVIVLLCVNASLNNMHETYDFEFEDICRILQSICAYVLLLGTPTMIVYLIIYLYTRDNQIVVTDKRVYGKTIGKQIDLPLDSISSVGTSWLKGIAVGTSSGRIKFLGISNRNEIYEAIKKILADRQTKETKASAPVTNITQAQSSADELKKFKELLDSGIITQEEFDAKKKQLLGL